MTTFFMYGDYTKESLEGISAARTRKANAVVRKHKGKTKGIYALLGEHDLVLIVELPDVETAMQVSMELTRLTGVSFSSTPAVDVKAFDEIASA